MKRTLAEWLDLQQRIHPRGIDLGLDRVRRVYEALGSPRPAPLVITIGGTNGKGSTVAFVESVLRAAGHRGGAYTSPHLLDYTERVRIDGRDVSENALVDAFERIDAARGDTTLTYFEFGTLAAFLVMQAAKLDVAVLEVGLGGRLDAVNLIDADVAIVTTVDLDHREYLGDDRDVIGFEKAGIFRASRPAIVGDADVPRTVLDHASAIGAKLEIAGRDFRADGDRWVHRDGTVAVIPQLPLDAPVQIDNAAAAIAALHAVRDRWSWSTDAILRGLAGATVAGRLQRIRHNPDVVLDVGHNPQAARELKRWLDANPIAGRDFAVFSALADKDVDGIVAPLRDAFDHWFVGGLEHESPRGLGAESLLAPLAAVSASGHARVEDAYRAALTEATGAERIVVFGSFLTVAAVLRLDRP